MDKQEIIDNDYVFSFNKYQKKEIIKKTYRPTDEIMNSISKSNFEFLKVYSDISGKSFVDAIVEIAKELSSEELSELKSKIKEL